MELGFKIVREDIMFKFYPVGAIKYDCGANVVTLITIEINNILNDIIGVI